MEAKIFRFIGPAVAVLLFVAAVWVLHHEVAALHFADILREMEAIPAWRLLLSIALTALGYAVLTGYDALSLRYIDRRLPYPKIALASFISYTFSHNIGLGLLTGGSVRYRLYSAWGLSAGDVTRVVGFGALTLSLGFLSMTGAAFLLAPRPLPDLLQLLPVSPRLVGATLLAVVVGYVVWSAFRRAPIKLGGWVIAVPSAPLAVAQITIASLDWIIAAAVFHVLLPSVPGVGFLQVLGAFLLAAGGGVVSHVPGGLGVFETILLVLLPATIPAPSVLGALIAFRVVYYILPLGVAAVLLASHELLQKREHARRLAGTVGRWVPALAPQVFALGTFVAGAVLLFSGATPPVGSRLEWLGDLVPLPIIEIAHFLGSLAGAGLLLLARGLQRRLDAAYVLTLVLLAGGILFCLFKGVDYEEAAILAVLLAALWPCHRAFNRRASLISERFTPGWVAAIAIVVLASFGLGLFAHKHVGYAHELWWSFALESDAPRFLRASVGVTAVVLIFAMARLLRPGPPEPARPTAADIERAAAIVAQSPRASASLALLGDKSLLFSTSGNAFVMYGISGQSWVSAGDPVGPRKDWPELAWRFREMSDRHGRRAVFYEVGAASLPLYLDLGLTLLKLGEEATIALEHFSLESSSRKGLRYTRRRLAREGCRYEIAPPDAISTLLPELKEISDAWLQAKKTREKGFSLGRFDPAYLRHFPIALVRKEGRIIAFANLWLGAGKQELSVDLMRLRPEAPRSVMEYLFIEAILWGKGEGYRSFSLGMAPLSGLEDRALAPAWSRVGAYIFRHGEHFYNFQGLRSYKEKFDPVWEPRYLACPGGLALPRILADTATLISGGLKGIVGK